MFGLVKNRTLHSIRETARCKYSFTIPLFLAFSSRKLHWHFYGFHRPLLCKLILFLIFSLIIFYARGFKLNFCINVQQNCASWCNEVKCTGENVKVNVLISKTNMWCSSLTALPCYLNLKGFGKWTVHRYLFDNLWSMCV